MANVLVVDYEDFRKLAKDSRIYYYVGDSFYDFHFISNNVIIKTTVMKTQIENPTRFFSNPVFYNAIKLEFNIPVEKPNPFDIEGKKIEPTVKITDIQEEEVKTTDVQKEGTNPYYEK